MLAESLQRQLLLLAQHPSLLDPKAHATDAHKLKF
jgi:hypothetical protein